jgi:exportin-2 (importin alpha re-exporter)
LDRKTAVVSFVKTVANSEAFTNRYKRGWTFTCEALLKILELPPLPTAKDDIIAENDVDDMAFGVGFTQLNTVRPRIRDPWPEIGPDLKAWTGKYLKEVDKRQGGKISGFIRERLGDEAKAILGSYMAAA